MKVRWFFCFFFLYQNLFGVDFTPSTKSDFYLITVGLGPGFEMRYGHTILEIKDLDTQDQYYLNWGVFDFETPNFAWEFFSHKLLYWADVSKNRLYLNPERPAFRQKLNLTQTQKEKALISIKERLKPENAYFLYDFFFKNCSTIPRDVLDEALDYKLKPQMMDLSKKTFRDYVRDNLSSPYGSSFFLDIFMNSILDQPLSFWDESFYPLKLAEHLEHVSNPDFSENVFLLSDKKDTLLKGGSYPPRTLYLGYVIGLLWFVFLWILPSLTFVLWAFFSGFLGLAMSLCWLYSGHETFLHSTNLFLFWPTDFLMSFFIFCDQKYLALGRLYVYLHMAGWCLSILLFIFGVTTQDSSQVWGLAFVGLLIGYQVLWKKNLKNL